MASSLIIPRAQLRTSSSQDVTRRLEDAVRDFKGALQEDDKKHMKIIERKIAKSAEGLDILAFTQTLDEKYRSRHGSRKKYTDRLMDFLKGLEPLLQGVDIAIGGSQNAIACGVWGTIKLCLRLACSKYELLEKLTELLMEIGSVSHDYHDWIQQYPESPDLKSRVGNHLVIAIEVCTVAVGIFNSWKGKVFPNFESRFSSLQKRLRFEERAIGRTLQTLHGREKQSLVNVFGKSRIHRLATPFLKACSQHNYRAAFRRALTKGESCWAQTTSEFSEWRSCPNSEVLWVEGKVGSGKSVSTAHVVQSFERKNPTTTIPITAFFFCEFDNKDSLQARTILGALARQLFRETLSPEASLDFEEEDELSADQILEHLERILPPEPPGYYLVIDGLNECPKSEVKLFVRWLQRLLQTPQTFKVYMTVRSIMLQDVKSRLKPRWTLQVPKDRPEIKDYIDLEIEKLSEDGTLQTCDPDVIRHIKSGLLRKYDGMFLWLRFQLDRIGAQNTDDELREFIDQLPESLEDTYDRIMRELPSKDNPNHALRCRSIFAFVACAKRPLTLGELAEALSVQPEDRDYNENRIINDMAKALEQVGSLVIFDEVDSSVHFAHHSIRDHVLTPSLSPDLDKYHICEKDSELWVGKICVTYLTFRRFGMQLEFPSQCDRDVTRKYGQPQSSFNVLQVPEATFNVQTMDTSRDRHIRAVAGAYRLYSRLRGKSPLRELAPAFDESFVSENESTNSYPFSAYAKENWLWHTRSFQDLKPEGLTWFRWESLLKGKIASVTLPWPPGSFENMSKHLIQWAFEEEHNALICFIARAIMSRQRLDLRIREKDFLNAFRNIYNKRLYESAAPYYGLALLIAISQQDIDMAESLPFCQGIDLTTQSERGNALLLASSHGMCSMVELLLQAGMDVDFGGADLPSPLAYAAEMGKLEMVRMLLKAGADVASMEKSGDALVAATDSFADFPIVQTLVEYGSAINVISKIDCKTPLCNAARTGNLHLVKYFVRKGADPNFGSQKGGYPLEAASRAVWKNIEIVRYLLSQGADVNKVGGSDGTPLNASLRISGDHKITELLIQHGADITIQAGLLGNALQTAAGNGRIDAVTAFLSLQADCNFVGPGYKPALACAAYNGHKEIVVKLLEHGAEVNKKAETDKRETALYSAAQAHQTDVAGVMLLLIQHKALFEGPSLTVLPLHGAVRGGDIAAARTLLEAGADINTQEYPGPWNEDHFPVGTFSTIYMTTVLHCAAERRDPEFIKFLLENGAEVNQHADNNPNALFVATYMQDEDCALLLLEYGAIIKVTSSNGEVWDAMEQAQRLRLTSILQMMHGQTA